MPSTRTALGFNGLRIRSRREWSRLARAQAMLEAETRLLGVQILQRGLLPTATEVLRLLAHHDRETAIRRIAILLHQRLPEETPELQQQRLAHKAEFEALRPD